MKRIGILLAALALPFAAQAQQPIVMKMGGIATNDPSHAFLNMYKEKIEARTGGRIKGEVYPGAQLGGFPQLIASTQLGTLEMFMGPPGFMRGLDPRVQVADAPGLFENMEHAQRTFTDPRFRDKFLAVTLAKGIKGIGLYNHGPTSYVSTSPLRRLDDFKGKKIRVLATKVETEAMNRLGATGVPIDVAEMIPALQSKVLDGIRSSITIMAPQKVFAVAKYLTNVQDSMIPVQVSVSLAWFNKLPADLQKTVADLGRELEPEIFRISVEFDNRAAQAWRDGGGEVLELPPADQAEFMRRVRTVADDVMGNDPVLKELYAIYREVAESHRKKRG